MKEELLQPISKQKNNFLLENFTSSDRVLNKLWSVSLVLSNLILGLSHSNLQAPQCNYGILDSQVNFLRENRVLPHSLSGINTLNELAEAALEMGIFESKLTNSRNSWWIQIFSDKRKQALILHSSNTINCICFWRSRKVC